MALLDPLHPAVVHFPIALLVVGGIASFVAVASRSVFHSAFTAVLLTLGAAAAIVARQTGEAEEERLEPVTVPIHSLLEDHEKWATAATAAAALAAALAIWAWRATQWGAPGARKLRSLTATLALITAYGIFEAGSRGGRLVYEHGVGIRGTTIIAPATDPIPRAADDPAP